MAVATEKVASGTFKKEFGRVLEEARENPITITRHGRDFVTLLSSKDFAAIQEATLGEYFLEKVQRGEMHFLDALREEQRIMQDVAEAENDYAQGHYKTLIPNYIDDIKSRATARHES